MFNFIIKYFCFLKSIPLLASLFDSQLMLWELVSGSEIPECLDCIENEILGWQGTERGLHKYGGIQFNCKGSEIGHIHSNGILDIRFSRKIKQQLIAEGKISDHHVFTNSGWISFYIRKKEDSTYALELLKMSWLKINSTKC